jgi:hypothetical protein
MIKKPLKKKQLAFTTTSFAETEWLDSLQIPMDCRQIKIIIGNQYYIVDAFDSETNTVYEFHGDYWHGNPSIFHPYKINKQAGKTFKKLYTLTMEKEENLKRAGYKVISIWESDWNRSKLQ